MDFKLFVENSEANIQIDEKYLNGYKNGLSQYISDLFDSVNDENYRLKQFVIDTNYLSAELFAVKYPQKDNLIKAIQSKNIELIEDEDSKFRDWERAHSRELYKSASTDYSLITKLRKIQKYIWDVEYKLKNIYDKEYNQEDVVKETERIFALTVQECRKTESNLRAAISRMENWNGTPILIRITHDFNNKDAEHLSPDDSFEIVLADGSHYPPSFSYFTTDGKIVVDDVLDAGDDEFFKSDETTQDYFNLTRELSNPHSTKIGKPLTLYTARPVKDRATYENATTLPPNIFLTNSFSHADGLAQDLGGERELWKVKIDSKYLLKTMDDGSVKYYQVIGTKPVPIKSISLA